MKQFAHTTGARYNSRFADQFPKGTDLHERAMQMVQSDLDDFVAVHPDTHARCRREYFEADEYKMHVFGTCGSRDPQSKYEVKELTTLAPTHPLTLISRATHAHPTSPRSTGFCAIVLVRVRRCHETVRPHHGRKV